MHSRFIIGGMVAAAAVLLSLLTLGPVPAAEASTLQELRERFEARYPQIARAKREGVIGETWEGTVAVVRGREASESVGRLVREENADRRTLYRIIAQREETTPEHVARRNAQRNFQRANAGEYLRDREGKWYRKSEDDG